MATSCSPSRLAVPARSLLTIALRVGAQEAVIAEEVTTRLERFRSSSTEITAAIERDSPQPPVFHNAHGAASGPHSVTPKLLVG